MRKIYQSSPFNDKKMFSGKYKHIFPDFSCTNGHMCVYERYAHENQDPGKCYQPRPWARLITLTSTLIIPDITKTSSNNFFYIRHSSESQACYGFKVKASFNMSAPANESNMNSHHTERR